MEDVIGSGYYDSPLGYNIVDWYVNEVTKLENKMVFYFKNTEKDIVVSKEDEEYLKKSFFVDSVKKKYLIKLEITVT